MTRATERFPDIHAVVIDDYLLDRLAVGSGRRDNAVEGALHQWRDQLLLDLPPVPSDRELRAMVRGRRRFRRGDGYRRPEGSAGRSWHAVTGIAASIVLLLAGTTAIGARAAQPGDLLWPVTQALWGDRADSVLAHRAAAQALDDARSALGTGDLAGARMALAQAAAVLPMIAMTDGREKVAADLQSLTATILRTSAATPPAPSRSEGRAGGQTNDVPAGPTAPSAHAAPDPSQRVPGSPHAAASSADAAATNGGDSAGRQSAAVSPSHRAAPPAQGKRSSVPSARSADPVKTQSPHSPASSRPATVRPQPPADQHPSSRASDPPTSSQPVTSEQTTQAPTTSSRPSGKPAGPTASSRSDTPSSESASATSSSPSASASASKDALAPSENDVVSGSVVSSISSTSPSPTSATAGEPSPAGVNADSSGDTAEAAMAPAIAGPSPAVAGPSLDAAPSVSAQASDTASVTDPATISSSPDQVPDSAATVTSTSTGAAAV